MNFQELIGKIAEIDKPIQQLKEEKVATLVKSDMDLNAFKKLSGLTENEQSVEECGMGPGPMGMSGMQNDPVTMNVTMNARGGESIRDLLDILTGKMAGSDDNSVEGPKGVIVSQGGIGDVDLDEKFANEPEEEVKPMTDVIPTGDDLSSKGMEAPKVNGGGNPFAARGFDESMFKEQLKNLYQEVKSR